LSISSIIKNRREEVINIAQKYGAKNVRVFGSMARGEESAESDLDIIVEMEHGSSLLDIIAIKRLLVGIVRRHRLRNNAYNYLTSSRVGEYCSIPHLSSVSCFWKLSKIKLRG